MSEKERERGEGERRGREGREGGGGAIEGSDERGMMKIGRDCSIAVGGHHEFHSHE